MTKDSETSLTQRSRNKPDLSQINRLGTFIAAGSLIGTIIGVIAYIVVGGAIGAIFPGAGTIVGTVIGGIVGVVEVMHSNKHSEP